MIPDRYHCFLPLATEMSELPHGPVLGDTFPYAKTQLGLI
jgi:hypothetical protein